MVGRSFRNANQIAISAHPISLKSHAARPTAESKPPHRLFAVKGESWLSKALHGASANMLPA
jgi:hypothetical protein